MENDLAPLIGRLLDSFCEAQLAGSHARAKQAVDGALLAGLTPLMVYREIFLPAQNRLGELWQRDLLGIAQEHIATQITISEMARLRGELRPQHYHGTRVVISVLPGEQHTLGAQMVADFFLVDGWEVLFLGTETPPEALYEFIQNEEPSLAAISINSEDNLAELRSLLAFLKKLPKRPMTLAGGRLAMMGHRSLESVGVDAVCTSVEEAVLLGRRLVGLPETHMSLSSILKRIGAAIQQLRKQQRMSQQDLAKAADLDRAYISSLENGKQNLTIGALFRIARALHTPLEHLISPPAPLQKTIEGR